MNRDFCSIRWYADEDYSAVKNEISNNDFTAQLTDLFFSNWPEKEIFPVSFDTFFERLFKMSMFVSKTITGLCF